ncbi:MAG: DNA recombination protein RmuC [Sphingobacteriales bacterium]|nr:DNA recombination protein RmuC [Sphingobacteriales bacterium]
METLTLTLLSITIVLLIVIIVKIFKPTGKEQDINGQLEKIEQQLNLLDKSLKDEFSRNREESSKLMREMREELQNSLLNGMKGISDMQKNQLDTTANQQKGQLDSFANQQKLQFESFTNLLNTLTKSNEERLEKMRETIETRIRHLQEDNAAKVAEMRKTVDEKLEEMRKTVDEKLQSTLEKRLGESFKLVSERLEAVHKGLGDMQSLAAGVGDLKKVLSNVKTKGVLGEYQLENLLEQMLSPSQYERNVATKLNSNNRVEFAVKLPGREDKNKTVYLPMDAKFPTEDYQSLMDAYDNSDLQKIEEHKKNLAMKIRQFAKDISEKYIDPPRTTDFAIMFLPFEGLYAEVLRMTGVFEQIQREYKVVITGPTTLSALLNSLQMGFRTLAIEKRSSEVWDLLSAVKKEFGYFGDLLEKTHKKLQEASNSIEAANKRTNIISRKLKDVQELPAEKSNLLIELNASPESEAEGE